MTASTVDSTVALVTLEQMKEYLQITSGTTDDALLSTIINGISQRIHSYCQRNLLSKSYTQYYSGRGTESIMLAMAPVTAISSVKEDLLRVFGTDTVVPSADMIIEPCGRIKLFNNRQYWLRGSLSIKVVYTAGYSLATLPADIALAAKEFCAAAYYKAKNRRHGVQSESIGDKTISYINVAIPPEVSGALDPYVLPASAEEWLEEVSNA